LRKLVRALWVLVLVGALAFTTAVSSFAMEVSPGPEFGGFVSTMAAVEQHPLLHGGQHFGVCVSTHATTGDCPHEH
jgi:hypothetical protein